MYRDSLKSRNTKYLNSFGITVPAHLPIIEDLDEVKAKTAVVVASRVCAVAYVVGLGFGANGHDLLEQIEKYSLLSYVSEYEKTMLNRGKLSGKDIRNISCLIESAQALAWCISLVSLDHFRHCDDDLAKKIPFKIDPTEFIESAIVRPITDIQEQSDLLYRMHWYTKNCDLTGQDCLLKDRIVSGRRKAIDWVYGVAEDWDDVSLDT